MSAFDRYRKTKRSERQAGRPLHPGSYMLAGITLHCTHCDAAEFVEGSAQLNTSTTSALLGVDFKTVFTLLCTGCGLVQWMTQPPKRAFTDSSQF